MDTRLSTWPSLDDWQLLVIWIRPCCVVYVLVVPPLVLLLTIAACCWKCGARSGRASAVRSERTLRLSSGYIVSLDGPDS